MGLFRHAKGIGLAAGVALTALGAAAQTAPTPPPRPHGLAPEAPLKDAPALRETPLRAGKSEHVGKEGSRPAKPAEASAAQPETPPMPPPRPEGLDKPSTAAKSAPVKTDAGKTDAGKSDTGKSDAGTPGPAKPDTAGAPPSAIAVTAPAAVPADACMVELAALGVDAPKADAPASAAGCDIDTPVRLRSVAVRDGKVAIHGETLIACATARAAALYLAQNVAPTAKGATGVALSGVTAAGFECRPRNRQPGGKLSAHGKGLALDVMSFQFADGSTTTVAAPGERLAFLNGARKAACGYFTTVLGPGADEAHRDHLHLDVEAHGSSGYGRICQ